MSMRRPELLIDDILESCSKILAYTDGLTYEDFCKDNKTIDAVIRNFEIIGEATGRPTRGIQRPTHRNRLAQDPGI